MDGVCVRGDGDVCIVPCGVRAVQCARAVNDFNGRAVSAVCGSKLCKGRQHLQQNGEELPQREGEGDERDLACLPNLGSGKVGRRAASSLTRKRTPSPESRRGGYGMAT